MIFHHMYLYWNQIAPIKLLKNVNPLEWLCNGSRHISWKIEWKVIDAQIAIEEYCGEEIFLLRNSFIPIQSNGNPFPL